MNVPEAKLQDTLAFITEWLEHGDLAAASDKFAIDRSFATKMLKGKARPRVDFLKELLTKAQKNYQKLRL